MEAQKVTRRKGRLDLEKLTRNTVGPRSGGHFTLRACVRADGWLTALDQSIAQAWASYTFSGRFLRCAVRQDRNRYLDSLVQDVRASDLARPKQLFQRVRKAFPKAASSSRSAFVPLPAVELETGDLLPPLESSAPGVGANILLHKSQVSQ